MKKIFMIACLVAYSHFSNAQNASETVSFDTTKVENKIDVLQQRLSKQEQEMQAVKKENETLKKQVKMLQSSIGNTPRKVSVSRTGSKQVVIE